jgi:predicted RNase H-like nuclease
LRIYGVDFTCAPRKAKPITAATGRLEKSILTVEGIERLESFAAFEAFLARPGPWIGGFDFPFSLPRELVQDLGWPADWPALVAHCSGMDRPAFRARLDSYRASRPVGRKYAHRATDYPAGSSSPMKLVNPPVALMFHEGARRLLAAGIDVPILLRGDASRIALEAYPGLLARKQLGLRASYKSDTRREHTPARKAVRRKIVAALKAGRPLAIRVRMRPALERQAVNDGSGDLLDAVICAVQAAWGWTRRRAKFGLPAAVDSGEGWIVTA